jgi:type IV pilus assembly protein PilX
VLISSLLLLLVVTIIALSMFRSFGMQEKIAGNMREKQRALQAAVSAQQYAENWLSQRGSTNATVDLQPACSMPIGQGQICNLALSQVVPGGDVTTCRGPSAARRSASPICRPGMVVNTTPPSIAQTRPIRAYYSAPIFYIADMGPSSDPTIPGEIYQIDAVGYGGVATTAAVVESTYAVYTSSSSPTGLCDEYQIFGSILGHAARRGAAGPAGANRFAVRISRAAATSTAGTSSRAHA